MDYDELIAFAPQRKRPTSPCRCTRCRWRRRTATACSRRTTTAASSTSMRSPTTRSRNLICMGIYVFNRDVLIDQLCRRLAARARATTSAATSCRRWSRSGDRVFGYRFDGYWRDVGTIQSYWSEHGPARRPARARPVRPRDAHPHALTRLPAGEDRPRAPYISAACSSSGCIINGHVEHSVLSPGVFVEEGAVVRDSILFDDCRIERGRRRRARHPRQGSARRRGLPSSATATTTRRTGRGRICSGAGSRSSASAPA